jgi:hypothetical protein
MENHSFCEAHPSIEDADVENCPFCDDRAAYLEFVKKAGEPKDPFPGARMVSLAELNKQLSTD